MRLRCKLQHLLKFVDAYLNDIDNRWSLRARDWIPRDGKRARGKQEDRWADEINKFAGIMWP